MRGAVTSDSGGQYIRLQFEKVGVEQDGVVVQSQVQGLEQAAEPILVLAIQVWVPSF